MQSSQLPQSPSQDIPSLSARIWKFKLHYVLPVPALLILLLIVLPPLFNGFVLPFKAIKMHLGIVGSPWTGLDNVRALFADPLFRLALTNTFTIKLIGTLLGGLLAFGLAVALQTIRSRLLRGTFVTLFLIPFVVPSAAFAHTIMGLFSLGSSPFPLEMLVLGEPALIKPVVIAAVMLKTCGIPVAIALAAMTGRSRHGTGYAGTVVVPALRAICAYMLLQCSVLLVVDFDFFHVMINPLVMESIMTLDAYIFRAGFQMAQIGLAGAAWLVQFLLQLPLLAAAYFLIRRYLSNHLFPGGQSASSGWPIARGWRIAGATVVSLYGVLVLFVLFRQFVHPFLQTSDHVASLGERLSAMPFAEYLLVIVFVVIAHSLFNVMLAYPLTVRTLPGRGAYKAVLLLLVAAGPMMVQQFFYFRPLLNTLWPYMLLGLFNLLSVFVLKERFNQQFGEQKRLAEQSGRGETHTLITLFLPNIWRPLIGLGVLQAIALWNSFLIPLLYNTNPAQHLPIMTFRSLAFAANVAEFPMGDPLILRVGALVSLPPLLLFLVFRRWVTADLFLSQIRRY